MQHLINLNQITKISIYYKKENENIIYYSKPCTLRDLLLYVIGKFKPYYTANQCADRVTTNSGSGNSSGKPKFTVSNSKWPDYMSKVGTSNATVNKWKGSASKE